ncbi:MAG: hypothetical protein Q9204_003257 [Flavoplaca sp. TL-2023a]
MAPSTHSIAPHDEEVITQTQPYTVFRKWEKVYVVALITLTAWFSTLSSFIYYPVITFVARDLRTTMANINLTVTTYMVVSGITPALIGDLADQAGRRLTYVIALVVYFCANIGIAVQNSFVALLLLRMLQSAGISGTFSIAYGVLVDISTSAERGSYVSALSFGEVVRKSGGHIPNPMACLKVLCRKDTFIVVTAGGIIYMSYSCMQASLSTLCVKIYSLGQLEARLIYLPFGFGSIVLTCVSGKILDRDYRITANSHNLPVDKIRGDNLLTFPVKKARLRSAFIAIGIAAITFIGYGWSLHFHAHLSIPLILQFLLGLSVQMCFNINNTLLMDINFRTPATAQAASNIIRCALAAIAVAVLEAVIGQIGIGWTFTLLGFGVLGSGLLYWVDRQWGMKWRTDSGEDNETTEAMDGVDEQEKAYEMVKRENGCAGGAANNGERRDEY